MIESPTTTEDAARAATSYGRAQRRRVASACASVLLACAVFSVDARALADDGVTERVEAQKIVDANGTAGDLFGGFSGQSVGNGGVAVAIDGDVMVIGAQGASTLEGRVIVYRREAGTWVEEQTLAPTTPGESRFGASVAVSGEWLVVGATRETIVPAMEFGSASVFRWDGASWVFEQKLTATTGDIGTGFGHSVATDGVRIAVGRVALFGLSSVWVYRSEGAGWSLEQKLSGPGLGDLYGTALAIDDDELFVGAPNTWGGAFLSGYVDVWRRTGSTWSKEDQLTTSPAVQSQQLGAALALDDDVLLVGAPGARRAVSFVRDGSDWVEQSELAPDPGPSVFGEAVALDGGVAVVGARLGAVDGVLSTGDARVFCNGASGWFEVLALRPSDLGIGDQFGFAVAVQGDVAVVSSPTADVDGNLEQGAVYVFDVTPEPWVELGSALAGVAGEPSFEGRGELTPGSPNELTLADAAPSAPTLLFVGLADASVPFKGGTLVPFPTVGPPLGLVTDGAGAFELAFNWPAALPACTELWLQCAIADAAAVQGVALSNAVKAVTP